MQQMLYYIVSLHQTTTQVDESLRGALLYYIVSLHQTTTHCEPDYKGDGLYYIVSLHQTTTANVVQAKRCRCIISFLYIKPQPPYFDIFSLFVVLYRFSTSNHNQQQLVNLRAELYYIVSLHQTTTTSHTFLNSLLLYYIVSLHQTTTNSMPYRPLCMLYYIVSLHQTTTCEVCLLACL